MKTYHPKGLAPKAFDEALETLNLPLILEKQVRQVKWLFNNSNKMTMVYDEKLVRLLVHKLQSRIKELEEKTSVTLGVGDGSGQHFVHGSFETIRLLQQKLRSNTSLHVLMERLKKCNEQKYPEREWTIQFYLDASTAWENRLDELERLVLRLESELS
jgi:uncharacterized coiled-coil protein SlyX